MIVKKIGYKIESKINPWITKIRSIDISIYPHPEPSFLELAQKQTNKQTKQTCCHKP